MLDSVQPFLHQLTTDTTVFITQLKQLDPQIKQKQSIAMPDALRHTATLQNDGHAEKDLSKKDAIIGIGGGVGPAAGVALHSKIIENSLTDGTDQSHFEAIHVSLPDPNPDPLNPIVCATSQSGVNGAGVSSIGEIILTKPSSIVISIPMPPNLPVVPIFSSEKSSLVR